jgi:hypothetical protein
MQTDLSERHGEAEIIATEGPADAASADALNMQGSYVNAEIVQEHPNNLYVGQGHHYRRVETV